MKKILCIIIIFIILLTLTGCSDENLDDSIRIKRIEQINLLDVKFFTLYQYLSGIQINKEKLIVETEEMSRKQQQTHNSEEENDKEKGTYRVSDVINENNLLAEITDTNWKLAIEYFYEIQNVIYDIQIEMKNEKNDNNFVIEYQKELDGLMDNMINKEKEASILSLQKLYYYSEYFMQNYIKDAKLYEIKKMYYDSIRGLIFSELDMKTEYTNTINTIIQDMEKVNQIIQGENTKYLRDRLNIIVPNLQGNETKENKRLKLVMLIETIPNLEKHITNEFDKE